MDEINDFVSRVPSLQELQSYELVEYFIYFLTVINGKPHVKTPEIEECFRKAHLPAYLHISQYLSRKSSNKAGQTPIFIRDTKGYCLTRFKKDELDKKISAEPEKRETSKALSELLDNLVVGSERYFLKEAIDCYEIGAYRATIIMVWILTLDHLYEYILAHKLADFNAELAKIKDKRIKVNVIASKDDFCDIPEIKFIEISRAANIISNDVRKILDVKLGIRNSCAHPSGIKVAQVKATDFIQDLVSNVLLKYPLLEVSYGKCCFGNRYDKGVYGKGSYPLLRG